MTVRHRIVAGNWKMNKSVSEAAELLDSMLPDLRKLSEAERVVCPPLWRQRLLRPGWLARASACVRRRWEIDGALVGGASLKPAESLAIIAAA